MIPRLRVFAGPNGSGKSTLVEYFRRSATFNLYTVINPDEIKKTLETQSWYELPFAISLQELKDFAEVSKRPDKEKITKGRILIENNQIHFEREIITDYSIAIFADFLREEFLKRKKSFSTETVFSHPSKIDLLKRAQERGYRVYLYFIATENPELNILRVRNRVEQGGHDVLHEKIRTRYAKCIENAVKALCFVRRAYFFDNSFYEPQYLGELTENGKFVDYQRNNIHKMKNTLPLWFNKILSNKEKL
ncbi:MAG: zeta toxin family protein [Verrucomicrobia bacterium]|nr:zeta toxin family protein [Verrucomicrobiota bacterium]